MSTITNIGNYNADIATGSATKQRHAHNGHPLNPTQFVNDLFSALDSNQTGSIDKTQLENAFAQSASNSTNNNDKADNLFAAFDTNGDGQLTQAEMTAAIQQKMSAASEQFATRIGMQGKAGHHHRPDGDADDATNLATSATKPATVANQGLQRQLMEMMRIMGVGGTNTAQTAAVSAVA